jgi:hypothetical protein
MDKASDEKTPWSSSQWLKPEMGICRFVNLKETSREHGGQRTGPVAEVLTHCAC